MEPLDLEFFTHADNTDPVMDAKLAAQASVAIRLDSLVVADLVAVCDSCLALTQATDPMKVSSHFRTIVNLMGTMTMIEWMELGPLIYRIVMAAELKKAFEHGNDGHFVSTDSGGLGTEIRTTGPAGTA